MFSESTLDTVVNIGFARVLRYILEKKSIGTKDVCQPTAPFQRVPILVPFTDVLTRYSNSLKQIIPRTLRACPRTAATTTTTTPFLRRELVQRSPILHPSLRRHVSTTPVFADEPGANDDAATNTQSPPLRGKPGGLMRILIPTKDGLKDVTMPEESRRLYVGNLAFDVKERDIAQLVEPHGSVDSIRVVVDSNGLSRG